jgi:hypothetical protein
MTKRLWITCINSAAELPGPAVLPIAPEAEDDFRGYFFLLGVEHIIFLFRKIGINQYLAKNLYFRFSHLFPPSLTWSHRVNSISKIYMIELYPADAMPGKLFILLQLAALADHLFRGKAHDRDSSRQLSG